MDIPEMLPVYVLVMEQDRTSSMFFGGVAIWHIVKSIPCDIRDYQHVWDREIAPLNASGRYVTGFLVAREPDTIVRDLADKPEPQ